MVWSEMLVLGVALAAIVGLLLGTSARKLLFIIAGTTGLILLALLLAGFILASFMRPVSEPVMVDVPPAIKSPVMSPREGSIVARATNEAERPAWVDAPSGLTEGKYERTVSAGPFDTPSQSEFALLEQLRLAVNEYGDGYITSGAGPRLKYSNRELLELAPRRWVQQVDTTVGPMLYHHARLELDDSARSEMKQRWKSLEVDERLLIVLAAVVAILSALAALYAVLCLRRSL